MTIDVTGDAGRTQRLVERAGAAALVIALLFPPFIVQGGDPVRTAGQGHAFLLARPHSAARVDWQTLGVYLLGIAVVTALARYSARP